MKAECGHTVRGFPGEKCGLDEGHKGYHSCVTYVCDSCSKVRRGVPYRTSVVRLGDGTVDETFGYCFLCVRKDQEDYYKLLNEGEL